MMSEATIVSVVQSKANLIRYHLIDFTSWSHGYLGYNLDDFDEMPYPELYSEAFNTGTHSRWNQRVYVNGFLSLQLNELKTIIHSKSESLSEHAYNLTRHQIKVSINELHSRIQDLKTEIEEKHKKKKALLTDFSAEDVQLMCDFELERFEKYEVKYVSDLEDMVNRLLPSLETTDTSKTYLSESEDLASINLINGPFLIALKHLQILKLLEEKKPINNTEGETDLANTLFQLFPNSFTIKKDSIRSYLGDDINIYSKLALRKVATFLKSGGYKESVISSFKKFAKEKQPNIKF
jgi:hypothetical protein